MANQKSEQLVTQHGEVTELSVLENPVTAIQAATKEDWAAIKASLKEIDETDFSKAQSISSSYFEAEKGDVLKGVFTGWEVLAKEENGDTKALPAIKILTKDGIRFSASMQLVDAFKPVPVGVKVQITCLGKKNRMKLFDVKVID